MTSTCRTSRAYIELHMKKRWHDPEYKLFHKKHAAKCLEKRIRTKHIQSHANQVRQNHPSTKRSRSRKAIDREFNNSVVYVDAPSAMCFLSNPDGMTEFIDKLSKFEQSRVPVFVVMRNVKQLELNAIAVLLSVMVRFKSSNVKFKGDLPKDHVAKKLLIESRFFDHLYNKYRTRKKGYHFRGSTIFTHGQKLVDAVLSKNIIENASKTIWGQTRRCPGVQRTFIELMMNTNNHADPDGEKHYWISVHHIRAERRVVFTFVDFGVGIFENLLGKPESNRFFGIIKRWFDKRVVDSNSDVLRRIFDGELHTSTNSYYRGKGLPGIYSVSQKNQISNLALLSNDVYYESSTGAFRTLTRSFSGTLITWELNAENDSIRRSA